MILARSLSSVIAVALLSASTAGLALASRPTPPRLGWQMLGHLAEPRELALSVPLPDGNILVIGGLDQSAMGIVRTTSEIVDPYSGFSRVLPQHLLGRVNHTATRTHDLVVVAGGTERLEKAWSALDRVEVFDSRRETWRAGASMTDARSDHGATMLRDGRVLVAGGTDGPRQLRSVEIYDPGADSWTSASPLPETRSQFSIATLGDGRVLVAGGLVRGIPSSTSAIYDPARDMWIDGPPMHLARVLHTAVKLQGGDVMIIGGQRDGGGSAERYDVRRNAFVSAGTLVRPRMLGAAVRLPDGRVLVVGGLLMEPSRDRFLPTSDAEVWDPSTNVWTDVTDPSTARALGSFVLTQAGALWIGGATEGERAVGSIERFTWR